MSQTDNSNRWVRVEREIQAGRIWRAKEILQGAIATSNYDPALFERYGQLLLRMGDTVEAGKYLFLSGVRKPEYKEAISLFVDRFTRKDPSHLPSTFPTSARSISRDAYPPVVAEELARLNVPVRSLAANRREGNRLMGWFVGIGCVCLVVVALVLMFLGLLYILHVVRG